MFMSFFNFLLELVDAVVLVISLLLAFFVSSLLCAVAVDVVDAAVAVGFSLLLLMLVEECCVVIISNNKIRRCLEALPVDDGWAGLVVFLLGNPHLLEGGQRGQDGATDPDGVFALWWGDDLDLHGGWGEGGDFLLHTIGDSWVHGGTAG